MKNDKTVYSVELSRENIEFLTFCMLCVVVNRPPGISEEVISNETAEICPAFYKAMENNGK